MIWIIYYFAYFGLQYQMHWMETNIWFNFTLFGLSEIVGIYFGVRILKEFKMLIRPLGVLIFVAGFGCLIFQNNGSIIFVAFTVGTLSSNQNINELATMQLLWVLVLVVVGLQKNFVKGG